MNAKDELFEFTYEFLISTHEYGMVNVIKVGDGSWLVMQHNGDHFLDSDHQLVSVKDRRKEAPDADTHWFDSLDEAWAAIRESVTLRRP